MKILQTARFARLVKKLHPNQKKDLDSAVRFLAQMPDAGEKKVGDLAGVFVYKFKMNKQLTLLAYSYQGRTLTLLTFGSHENFYRDLKN